MTARVVLFGTGSAFSATVYQQLANAPVNIIAVVVAGEPSAQSLLPVVVLGQQASLEMIAASQSVPVRYTNNVKDPELARWLGELAPDFILVACFPYRLPETLTALPRQDCLNLHPSMLPRYRGPTPLFWQLRAGEKDTGITLHRVISHMDAGNIMAQENLTWPDGSDATDIDTHMGGLGTRLFIGTLAQYESGSLLTRPQDESASSYFPTPGEDDFRVDSQWSARRIFNFMRATSNRGQTWPVRLDNQEYRLTEALGFSEDAGFTELYEIIGGKIRIRCGRGILTAAVEQSSEPSL